MNGDEEPESTNEVEKFDPGSGYPAFMAQMDQDQAEALAFARKLATFWNELPSSMPEKLKRHLTLQFQMFSHVQSYEADEVQIFDESDIDPEGPY